MSIELSSELERQVTGMIGTGRYQSASDVLEDALGLLQERELYTATHRDEIRSKIATGYESLRAGRGVDGEAVFERIENELVPMDQPAK
jgi:antitoxin ParD1/3/4